MASMLAGLRLLHAEPSMPRFLPPLMSLCRIKGLERPVGDEEARLRRALVPLVWSSR